MSNLLDIGLPIFFKSYPRKAHNLLYNEPSKASIWVNNHFGVSPFPLIKFLVCDLRITEADLVRDDKARLCFAGDNHVS